jgi:hypothetical protein
MSDDLVKRLRHAVKGLRSFYRVGAVELIPAGTMDEAADRIEELEAKLQDMALDCLAAQGQAEEAYQAQLAAEARIETLEHTLDRVAAVLRLSLKYNTAMHGGASAHNQHLRDTLAEIERIRGASGEE